MLEREPQKRITLPELKKEPFFEEIDWEKIERKEIEPPIDPTDLPLESKEKMVNNMEKENSNVEYTDNDYTESNAGVNRYPNITFVRNNN